MVRCAGEATPIFAVTPGDAAAAGAGLSRPATAAGSNKHGHVHGLGDGAIWAVDQMGRQFGAQCRYRADFFRVYDHLAAAKVCAANDPGWMERQEGCLKTGRPPAVLAALAPFRAPRLRKKHLPVGATVARPIARANPTATQPSRPDHLSDPVKRGARIDMSSRNASNRPVPGGSQKTPKPCRTSAPPGQTADGIDIGIPSPLESFSTGTFDYTRLLTCRRGSR